ncbi:uncharacterized protein LOC106164357 isoform X2 [Lingula anatina]|uniref:Uncharacterized protein LOC106164357 isoform X2 n=1 Tax=Lingula anatina TaxID=7574 RepID=A0A1S3III7_LINAN|nr:uncharacterized protein LOC106164357 isoform X2 [Lingula anatina]|eukprot:XP_013397696.1 uncharacterized protein LOC106164357 isoform X2 [Lingula anatina]
MTSSRIELKSMDGVEITMSCAMALAIDPPAHVLQENADYGIVYQYNVIMVTISVNWADNYRLYEVCTLVNPVVNWCGLELTYQVPSRLPSRYQCCHCRPFNVFAILKQPRSLLADVEFNCKVMQEKVKLTVAAQDIRRHNRDIFNLLLTTMEDEDMLCLKTMASGRTLPELRGSSVSSMEVKKGSETSGVFSLSHAGIMSEKRAERVFNLRKETQVCPIVEENDRLDGNNKIYYEYSFPERKRIRSKRISVKQQEV